MTLVKMKPSLKQNFVSMLRGWYWWWESQDRQWFWWYVAICCSMILFDYKDHLEPFCWCIFGSKMDCTRCYFGYMHPCYIYGKKFIFAYNGLNSYGRTSIFTFSFSNSNIYVVFGQLVFQSSFFHVPSFGSTYLMTSSVLITMVHCVGNTQGRWISISFSHYCFTN